MTTAAILLYSDGAPREKQEDACLRHCAERGYDAPTLVRDATSALRLLRERKADVIVTAYTPSAGPDIAAEVEAAGGRVERVRRGTRLMREVGSLIERLFAKGLSVAEISEVIEMPTGEVRVRLNGKRGG